MAQLNLGLLYSDGRGGLARDEAQAAAWYRKAALQNLPLGQLALGLAYATGRGMARDDRQAVVWFEKAANTGLPLAQYGLGMLYSNGRGVERDWVKAHLWLNLAASGAMSARPSRWSTQAANSAKKNWCGRGIWRESGGRSPWRKTRQTESRCGYE